MELLKVEDLTIHYLTERGAVKAVNGVSFSLNTGESIGLVGETGAGKTTTALGIMRLIQTPPGKIMSGRITFKGQDLLSLSEKEMQKVRGNAISMIFQDPMSALNPVFTVGDQVVEVIMQHQQCSKMDAEQKMLEMLEMVGIHGDRAGEYPHQFSGGMKQRILIAIALACNPELLIADEPTTALDVTIQAQVLQMINDLKGKLNTSMILITHDLGIVAECCDKVAIMYAGEIVEYGNLEDIFELTSHPYTKGLFGSIPKIDEDTERLEPIPGMLPNPVDLPEGCRFHPRCSLCTDQCTKGDMPYIEVNPGHFVRCCNVETRGDQR